MLDTHKRWMRQALREAERAAEAGEVPVGALVVKADPGAPAGGGRVVGRGHNRVERLQDPTAHAEVLAITAACETLGTKHLTGCTLYVTLEPCPMCAGALWLARLDRLVFGAFDEKAGACSTLYTIPEDPRLNHRTEIVSGIEEAASADLLRRFFRSKRERPGDTGVVQS